jgi:hypothetical protein
MLRRAPGQISDEAAIEPPQAAGEDGPAALLRGVGALAVLLVGAVHLEQYFAVHLNVVPVIGPLFALNFAGAVLTALGPLLPTGRLRLLLALGGIGLAVTSAVFFFISEHRPLFGFSTATEPPPWSHSPPKPPPYSPSAATSPPAHGDAKQ